MLIFNILDLFHNFGVRIYKILREIQIKRIKISSAIFFEQT